MIHWILCVAMCPSILSRGVACARRWETSSLFAPRPPSSSGHESLLVFVNLSSHLQIESIFYQNWCVDPVQRGLTAEKAQRGPERGLTRGLEVVGTLRSRQPCGLTLGAVIQTDGKRSWGAAGPTLNCSEFQFTRFQVIHTPSIGLTPGSPLPVTRISRLFVIYMIRPIITQPSVHLLLPPSFSSLPLFISLLQIFPAQRSLCPWQKHRTSPITRS